MNFINFANADTFLIFTAVNMGLAMLIWRRISFWLVAGAMLLALGLNSYNLPYELLSELRPDINPQLLLVVYLAMTSGLLAFLSIFKRWRSVDRLIITLCLGAVLVTTTLFHQVMVWQTLKQWEHDTGSSLLVLLSLEPDAFHEACERRSLRCHSVEKVAQARIQGAVGDTLLKIEADTLEQANAGGIAHHYGVFNDADGEKIAFVAYAANPDGRKIIVDEQGASKAHTAVRTAFYALDVIAHTTWLLGALAIAYFHRKRFARKKRTKQVAEAQSAI